MAGNIRKEYEIEESSGFNPFQPEWDEGNEEIHSIWSRIFKMGFRSVVLAGIVLLVLAFTAGTGMADDSQTTATSAVTATPASTATGIANAGAAADNEEEIIGDIEEYRGSVDPDSSLYGLMLAFKRLDETFTFNEREKINKKITHASEMLAEARTEIRKNNNEAAIRVLEEYRAKLNDAADTISESSDEDASFLKEQEMIAKHQAVLAGLLESHPDNRGLARAYDNSMELQEKFESRTGKEFVLSKKNGRDVLKRMDIDETREELKIKAKITDSATQVEVEVKFASGSTDNFTIAREIIDRLQLSEENINSIIKIEEEDEEDYKLKEELEAKAEVRGTISKVDVEYKFPLDKTNESDIVKGVHQKLSSLTQADILKVLEMKAKKERKETVKKEERPKIKAKITDNATQVEVEVKFASGSIDNFTIAREIVNRLQLSEENINSIIKFEKEDEEDYKLKEELEAKAEVKGTVSKVDVEYKFPLDKTNESDIVKGVHQKLSSLTQADILKVLEIKADGRKEIKEKEEKREKKEKIEEKDEKKLKEEIKDKEEKREKMERKKGKQSEEED